MARLVTVRDLANPVFNPKSRNPGKLFLVVGDEDKSFAPRMRGNMQVVDTDGLTDPFKRSAN